MRKGWKSDSLFSWIAVVTICATLLILAVLHLIGSLGAKWLAVAYCILLVGAAVALRRNTSQRSRSSRLQRTQYVIGMGVAAITLALVAIAPEGPGSSTEDALPTPSYSPTIPPLSEPTPADSEEEDPPYELPQDFTDSGCIYEVTNDQAKGAAPHQILKGGVVEQDIIAPAKYVWSIGVVIGYQGPQGKDLRVPVYLRLRDGKRTLFAELKIVKNNQTTEARFPPRRVVPGRQYTVQIENVSDMTIGVYMASREGATGDRSLGAARAYLEERRPDGERQEVLTGCVGAAARI